MILKSWKPSITTINYAVTYYHTLEEFSLLLRLEKPKKWQKNSKNLNCKFYKKKKFAKTCDIKKMKINP